MEEREAATQAPDCFSRPRRDPRWVEGGGAMNSKPLLPPSGRGFAITLEGGSGNPDRWPHKCSHSERQAEGRRPPDNGVSHPGRGVAVPTNRQHTEWGLVDTAATPPSAQSGQAVHWPLPRTRHYQGARCVLLTESGLLWV